MTGSRERAAVDIIVTGGAGFIGSALARGFAARGARVLVLDDFSTGRGGSVKEIEGITVVRGDIRDASAIATLFERASPGIVYHLAALHYIPECNRRPSDTIGINIGGAHNVLQATARARVRRLVFASSAAVYAPADEPLSEQHPLGPIDTYGASKVYGEILCRDFSLATRIPTTVCRFFNVYGPNDTVPHLVPTLVEQVLAGATELRMGNLTPRRDYIHVADLVRALLTLAEHPTPGCSTYNFGSGVDHSVQQVADLLVALAARPLVVSQDPARVRPIDRTRLLANIERARQELGWTPTVDLATGLRALLQRSA